MRLIDADDLNARLQERIGSPTSDELYEVNLAIIDAPTIDAITVKWLKELKNEPKMKEVIDKILHLWWKEQYADNGRNRA